MLGDQKVDEFGKLFLKCQNKNCHSCLIACGMGVESSIRQNFNLQKLVLTPNISSYTVVYDCVSCTCGWVLLTPLFFIINFVSI